MWCSRSASDIAVVHSITPLYDTVGVSAVDVVVVTVISVGVGDRGMKCMSSIEGLSGGGNTVSLVRIRSRVSRS